MTSGMGVSGQPRAGYPKNERERAASHFGVSPTEVTPEMVINLPPKGTKVSGEMEQLATMIAEQVKEDTSTAVLLLHSLEHEATGTGRVIDPARAKATPCTCFGFEAEEYCWSPGILGLMSSKKNPEQIASYCVMGKEKGGAGASKRFAELKSAIGEAHEEWEKKGGNLKEWWNTIGEKLEAKGIEV